MFKGFRFRFSLLTLLIVLTLAAIAVSHWRTSSELTRVEQQLKIAREDIRNKQRAIRRLNDELGWLTVDDETQVHVIAQKAHSIAPFPKQYHVPWQSSFTWRAYLPFSKRWRVCWSGGEMPANGVPMSKTGEHLLGMDRQSDGNVTLSVSHLSPWESGLALAFRCNDDVWSGVIPRDTLPEFRADEEISSDVAGVGEWGLPRTESNSSGPVVLLRQCRITSDDRTESWSGLMVWLEPVATEPESPTRE